MVDEFEVGDRVEWNSQAGRVRGTIQKKVDTMITFKGLTVHASPDAPQYLIKSDRTNHMAMHKGSALTKIKLQPAVLKPQGGDVARSSPKS